MRRRADYHYELPAELIAQTPAAGRLDSRLLGPVGQDLQFGDFPRLLPDGALIIANDARVRLARIRTTKRETGGAVELLLLEPTGSPRQFRAMARASKPVRRGAELVTASGAVIVVREGRDACSGRDGAVIVELDDDVERACERDGELPLPPYIRRPEGPSAADAERYQTTYAEAEGALAAPTAGLHFTPELIADLRGAGCEWRTITLHVGLGTFSPVRVDCIDDHEIHRERFEIPAATARAVEEAKSSGRPVVAIGTTVVRALEAAARGDRDETSLFITPGFEFSVVDQLLTNFHLPESSLMMLVCAFGGYENVMAKYRDAVSRGYRFFSFGDAMLLVRAQGSK